MHECCAGPFEAPGHSLAQLLGRLAHSGQLQGISSHRDIVLHHIRSFGLRMNAKKSVLFPSQQTVFRGSLGFRSDAGRLASARISNFAACLARFKPSCLSEYLPQVARPHGSGFPCAAPRAAPHEAVPLVNESAGTGLRVIFSFGLKTSSFP